MRLFQIRLLVIQLLLLQRSQGAARIQRILDGFQAAFDLHQRIRDRFRIQYCQRVALSNRIAGLHSHTLHRNPGRHLHFRLVGRFQFAAAGYFFTDGAVINLIALRIRYI